MHFSWGGAKQELNPDRLQTDIEEAFIGGGAMSFATTDEGSLPSCFRVTDLAAASIGAAGVMLARLMAPSERNRQCVVVDRRLASLWFRQSLYPIAWTLPPKWDSLAGVYETRDGWIRLHTNASHHRRAALAVLGVEGDREAVAEAISAWEGETLEAAIVEAGGCSAILRSLDAWASHPQGAAVGSEPLIVWRERTASVPSLTAPISDAPLQGVRILDLTRVLAGPICTRFLAGFGADVLRVDPPDWNEPSVLPETTLGKRCTGLDLRDKRDREAFRALLASADVLVHGYRSGALDGLGFDVSARQAINPTLIDVSLNAYGWSGPWSRRRGYDSLVQMSSGLADFAMRKVAADKPVALPVQALDHATGYLMAAAVLHGLHRRREGVVSSARLSLARTAHLLSAAISDSCDHDFAALGEEDFAQNLEETGWGSARRLRFPMTVDGLGPHWRYPARPLRSDQAAWLNLS
jgi:crotonobetainyl-CoA:carnitine CoA-transferase CaiB-like acyl-CoA transferase